MARHGELMKSFKQFMEESGGLKTLAELKFLLPEIIKVSQGVYDSWAQDSDGMDEELGCGGICQDIAGDICGLLSERGFECSTVSQEIGEQHVYTVVKLEEGVYEVDIPPYVYESGGGYNWRKIPNVSFNQDHVIINRLDGDPESFENYAGEY